VGSENSREELEEFFDSSGLRRRRSWCERVAAEGDLHHPTSRLPGMSAPWCERTGQMLTELAKRSF
jgi:hypothetical protein